MIKNISASIIKGLSVAVIVKILGLARDFLIFYRIGISSELDSYVYYLTIPAIITSIIVPFINLWTVPTLKDACIQKRSAFFIFILVISILLSCIALIASCIFSEKSDGLAKFDIILITTSVLVMFFSILSEYSASILIADGRVSKIYYGNLLINLPVVVILMFFESDVILLAIVSSSGFLVRYFYLSYYADGSINFKAFLSREHMLSPLKSIKSMNLLSLKNMTLGPALQLSVYIGRYYCSFLPEGSLSLYFYAFKAFDAFKGTFMFVFLTKFFSNIQKQNYHDAIITFKKYSVGTTLISLSLVFFLGGVVLLDRVYPSILIDYEDLMKIIKLSLYSSIILICYPILTLYQRLVVSFSVVNLQFYSVAMMLIFQIVVGFVFLQLNILSIKNILIILSTSMIIPTFFVFKIELFKNIK